MLFKGDLVHCPNLGEIQILHDYLIDVDDASGFIVYINRADSDESDRLLCNAHDPPVLIPDGSFLTPTFCDLHLHAPQFLYQGTGLHLPLMQWLDEYAFQAEERLDADPALARRVYQRLAERLIENGTGTVVLFGTIREETNLILADIMQRAGVRAYVGKVSMDISSRLTYVESSSDAALAAMESFVQRLSDQLARWPAHKQLIAPVITPRFVPTCSDPLLDGLGRLAESKSLRIQSHLAEANDQIEWVKKERGANDMHIFDKSKLLTPRTIQAHCTFLDSNELECLSSRGTSVAHCPLSNAYFSARPFALREALRAGVKVGLGTDVAGGYSLDIMSAMRHAVAVSRMREGPAKMTASSRDGDGADSLAIDWKEALYLATRGGATALGDESYHGLFEVGAAFDAQCIKLFDSSSQCGIGALDFFGVDNTGDPWVTLTLEVVERWWCLGDTRNRVGVWVQGDRVM